MTTTNAERLRRIADRLLTIGPKVLGFALSLAKCAYQAMAPTTLCALLLAALALSQAQPPGAHAIPPPQTHPSDPTMGLSATPVDLWTLTAHQLGAFIFQTTQTIYAFWLMLAIWWNFGLRRHSQPEQRLRHHEQRLRLLELATGLAQDGLARRALPRGRLRIVRNHRYPQGEPTP